MLASSSVVIIVLTIVHVHDLYSAVNISETPAVATVEKKEYVYETKEEAKQAFKELLREKVSYPLSLQYLLLVSYCNIQPVVNGDLEDLTYSYMIVALHSGEFDQCKTLRAR